MLVKNIGNAVLIVVAAIFLVLGLITLPLPLPTGIPLIVLASILLVLVSKKVRNLLRRYRQRHPSLNRSIESSKSYLPTAVQAKLSETDPE